MVACYPLSYQATAALPDGLRVTYTIQPMFGFHSDWTRRIGVRYGQNQIHQQLFEDTGWWRGSNLYRHKSGAYVIDEGEIGCFGFTVKPLSFDVPTSILCDKHVVAQKVQGDASRFYVDLMYLGTFIETPNAADDAPISFVPAAEMAEIALPDGL